MNCVKCGHPADNHLYGQFCNGGTDCMCRRSQHDVDTDEQIESLLEKTEKLTRELTASKQEAMAARYYIEALRLNQSSYCNYCLVDDEEAHKIDCKLRLASRAYRMVCETNIKDAQP